MSRINRPLMPSLHRERPAKTFSKDWTWKTTNSINHKLTDVRSANPIQKKAPALRLVDFREKVRTEQNLRPEQYNRVNRQAWQAASMQHDTAGLSSSQRFALAQNTYATKRVKQQHGRNKMEAQIVSRSPPVRAKTFQAHAAAVHNGAQLRPTTASVYSSEPLRSPVEKPPSKLRNSPYSIQGSPNECFYRGTQPHETFPEVQKPGFMMGAQYRPLTSSGFNTTAEASWRRQCPAPVDAAVQSREVRATQGSGRPVPGRKPATFVTMNQTMFKV